MKTERELITPTNQLGLVVGAAGRAGPVLSR